MCQLRACIHEYNGSGQHPELADPVKRAGAHRRQPHQQIYQKEGKYRHQSQREQVQRAVLGDAVIHRCKLVAEAALHAIAQHETGSEERQSGADAGGERNQQRADAQAEQRAHGQRHDQRARQRERSDQHIQRKGDGSEQPRRLCLERRKIALAVLERFERQETIQTGGKKADHQSDDEQDEQRALHAALFSSSNAPPQLLPWPAVQP